jgi:hypothetical protein
MRPAAPPLKIFDTLSSQASFGVEFQDPVSLQVQSNGLGVNAVGLEGEPITSLSGRFVWRGAAPALPNSLSVSPAPSTGYAPWTYSAAEINAALSNAAGERRLCRLALRTLPTYVFPSGFTVLRGRLRETPDVAGAKPRVLTISTAWLQWTDQKPNPVQLRVGPRCIGGPQGDFACVLVLPTNAYFGTGVGPKTDANGDLVLTLFVARPDPAGGAIWQQAQTPAGLITGVRDGMETQFAAPIAWSQLVQQQNLAP